MKNGRTRTIRFATAAFAIAAALPVFTFAQTPVDDDGNPLGSFTPSPAQVEPIVGNEDIPLLSGTDLEELVGPIALYPDELLAIVLPASAYPLQIVEAARFLEALEDDPSLQPDSAWDDSVVALLNYPEIIEHLNEDIDWTWRLGEATVAQQTDVVAAIERFRDRAYAAGNLKSDPYQNVTREDGVIEISPVSDDVIYVPYYEPERVVVYQPRPVYYYYPRAYPVYYYPYSSAYHFDNGFFWGVTTAFTIGWLTDSLHVYHHSYHGHPYYGWTYRDRWWYRRPHINVYNTTYVRNTNVTINRYYEGDRWRPRRDRVRYLSEERTVRNWHNRPDSISSEQRVRNVPREQTRIPRQREQQPITFRERTQRAETATYRKNERRTPVVSNDRESRRNAEGIRQTQSRQNVTNRQQPQPRTTTRVRQQLREDVVRQQSSRRDVTARTQPRREPMTQPQPRRETLARQQPQRSPVKMSPQSRERASAPRPERRQERVAPQRTESRRSEPRTQTKSRSETRPRPERRDERRARH